MNAKTLNQYLRDMAIIHVLQKNFEKEYRISQKNPEVVGTYGGRSYIRLECNDKAAIQMGSNRVLIVINWPGQITPYHVHDWVELQFMYSGGCEVTVMDDTFHLKEGQFVLLDTDTPHEVGKTDGDNILLNFIFDKKYLLNHYFTRVSRNNQIAAFFAKALNQKVAHQRYIVFSSSDQTKIHTLVESMLCEYYDPSICAEDILDSYMTLILCELVRACSHQMEKEEKDDQTAISILRYIENNYLQCTLENTAEFFCLNPNYMTRLLKKNTGKSFKELLLNYKFQKAERMMLYTDLPIGEIAHYLGYENRGYFNRKFSEIYGCLPNEYRNRNKI